MVRSIEFSRSVAHRLGNGAAAASLVLVATMVAASGGPPVAHASPSASGITFASHSIVDPIHAYGEPDVRITPDGAAHVSGPWGTGTQRSIWNRSIDGGRTFLTMHDIPVTSPSQPATQILGPGGGDTEISVDKNGRVYYSDLAVYTLKFARWEEDTRTMKTGLYVHGRENYTGIDRQWFATWDPADQAAVRKATGYSGPFPVNYLFWAEFFGGCGKSPVEIVEEFDIASCEAAAHTTDGVQYSPATVWYETDNDGNVVMDQQTGTVLQAVTMNKPRVSGDDAMINFGGDPSDPGVAIITRDPSKTDDPAMRRAETVKVATTPPDMGAGGLFPVVALDEARNAYLVWVTTADLTAGQDGNAWQIWYSSSPASSGWKTWSKPVRLSAAPANQNIMPWAVAGAGGRLAVVWYGTDDAASLVASEDTNQAWHVWLASVSNATSASPSIERVRVTRHPMHYGTICLVGAGCAVESGNRNLADFFEVGVDPRDGAIVVAYDDTSNELIQDAAPGFGIPEPVDGIADHRGAPVVTFARQNGGIGLFGKPVGGPPASGKKLDDDYDDATFDPLYGTEPIPALDLTGASVDVGADSLVIRMPVASLDNTAGAVAATRATSLQYVARWVGGEREKAEGPYHPIWYASVEVTPGGPSFFAGETRSIDLCSVSLCEPHILEYPAPPVSGVAIEGRLIANPGDAPDVWELVVPRSVVGSPTTSEVLESFGAYAFVRSRSAATPRTNAEGEADVTPILIDGTCCIDVPLSGQTGPVVGPKPPVRPVVGGRRSARGDPLPGTGTGDALMLLGGLSALALSARAIRALRPHRH